MPGSLKLRSCRARSAVMSVAAISYYVVGLFGYLAKAAHGLGLPVKPETLTGLSVPVVVFGMWRMVRAIRRRHAEEDAH